jgi:hypothetical protein
LEKVDKNTEKAKTQTWTVKEEHFDTGSDGYPHRVGRTFPTGICNNNWSLFEGREKGDVIGYRTREKGKRIRERAKR